MGDSQTLLEIEPESQTLLEQTLLEHQILLVQLAKIAFDAEAPPNVRHPPIVDASASREIQMDQVRKYLEVALLVVSAWDIPPDESGYNPEHWFGLSLEREQLELDMTVLKKRMDDALQNPEEHLEVAQVFKEVERVADHFRKLNFFLKNYKKEQEKEKADAQESAAKASGAPEAEELAAKASGAAPSTPNDEIPQQGRNAPQRGKKRKAEI